MFTFSFSSFLGGKLFSDLPKLREQAFLVPGMFGTIYIRLLAVADFENIGHVCIEV